MRAEAHNPQRAFAANLENQFFPGCFWVQNIMDMIKALSAPLQYVISTFTCLSSYSNPCCAPNFSALRWLWSLFIQRSESPLLQCLGSYSLGSYPLPLTFVLLKEKRHEKQRWSLNGKAGIGIRGNRCTIQFRIGGGTITVGAINNLVDIFPNVRGLFSALPPGICLAALLQH